MFYDAGFFLYKFYLVVLASTGAGFIILSLTGKEKKKSDPFYLPYTPPSQTVFANTNTQVRWEAGGADTSH